MRSGRCFTSQRAPPTAPSSSSAVQAYVTEPANGAPAAARRLTATAWAATRFLMSTAPRHHVLVGQQQGGPRPLPLEAQHETAPVGRLADDLALQAGLAEPAVHELGH